MLRSLFTGISGLSAHQQMLDVTANNIANVNTTGFKSSRAAFQDTLSQTIQGAAGARNSATTPPTPLTGGTNAIQIGLGVKLAGTEMNMSQGSNEATGVGTDLMINGDGFFAVSKNGQDVYTRSGAFHIDDQGHLATSDGALVSGVPSVLTAGVWGPGAQPNPKATPPTNPQALDLSALLNGYKAVTTAGVTTYTPVTNADVAAGLPAAVPGALEYGKYVSYTIDSSGTVNAVTDKGGVQPLGQLTMATFSNPNGLTKIGDSEYNTTAGSGDPIFGGANDGTHGSISAGYLEMSNVDLAAELTNLIIAQRGFQANSKTITTSDQILQTLVSMKQ